MLMCASLMGAFPQGRFALHVLLPCGGKVSCLTCLRSCGDKQRRSSKPKHGFICFSLYAPIKWRTVKNQSETTSSLPAEVLRLFILLLPAASQLHLSSVICFVPAVHPACLHSTANTFGKSFPFLGLNFCPQFVGTSPQ